MNNVLYHRALTSIFDQLPYALVNSKLILFNEYFNSQKVPSMLSIIIKGISELNTYWLKNPSHCTYGETRMVQTNVLVVKNP